MGNRWALEETISARGIKAKSAGLARRVERLIGSLNLCDSVQLWRDSQTDKTEPFVLFSLQQLAALRSLGATSTAATTVTGRSKAGPAVVEVSPRVVRTTAPAESTSALQRKLIERLTQEIPELAGCSSFAFERTRTKAADVPKWVATLTVEGRSVRVGSLTPARDLVKGSSLKLGLVGQVDGVKLVGKDVWMKFTLPTLHVLYFGIQAKKGKLDASGMSKSGNHNVAEIHNQVTMMLGHEIFDPEIGKRVLVDHAFIVAGGEITKAARNWIGNKLDATKRSQIMFMDREDVLNLFVVTNLPLPASALPSASFDDDIPF